MTRRPPRIELACYVLVGATLVNTEAAFAPPPVNGHDKSVRPLSEQHLAPHPGFDDDASFVRDVGQRVDQLTKEAARETDELKRAELLLTAAGLTLAHELEPACSRLMYHLAADVTGTNARVASLERVDWQLEECDKITADAAVDDENKNQWRTLRRRRDTLSAFRGALGVFLTLPASPPKETAVHALRQAASGLAILLESDDPRINAAATLWYAVLRSQAENVDAAIRMLPLSLASPRSQTQPYALFNRILRCELIARRGGEATAIALLVQLEERCDDWFPEAEVASQARASVLWARHRVVQTWRDRLDVETHAEERAWCDDQMQVISKELVDAGGQLLRLGDAIPLNTTGGKNTQVPHADTNDAKGN